MRMKLTGILLAVSLWTYAAAQTEKPSPFHPKPPPGPAKNGTTPHSKPDKGAADRQKTATPVADGPNTGMACFYVPKRDGAMHPLSASAPSFPIGSRVRVTNLENHKSVVVTITENTAIPDRIISVSSDAADQLGFRKMGSAQVHLEAAGLD